MKKTILSHFLKGCLKSLFVIIVSLFAMSFNVPKNDSQLFLKSTSNAPDKNISIINSNKVIKINKDNGYFLGAYPQVLPACSTASVSFICSTPDYGATSGTWSFHWTIGSGWTNSGSMYTTSNIIFLTPSSPSITPGSVSVVAYFTNNNGNTSGYNVGSRSVSRSTTFTTNAVINGNNTLCSGNSVFNLTNLPNNSTVQWSVSGISGVNIVSQSNSQVTLNTTATSGLCTLNTQITNQCGQSVTVSKVIPVGSPSPVIEVVRASHCSFEYKAKDYQYATTNNYSYNWELINSSGYVDFSTSENLASVNACPPFSVRLRLTTTNSCGNSSLYETDLWLNNDDEEINKQAVFFEPIKYGVYPNPANDVININLIENEFLVLEKSGKLDGEIYDIQGSLKKKFILQGKKETSVNVKDLQRGVYLLKINNGKNIENHRIVIY